MTLGLNKLNTYKEAVKVYTCYFTRKYDNIFDLIY